MTPNAKYRALVADDEEGLRFVLSQLLKREGCEVEQAANGEEAWKLAEAAPHDLYLLDMKMPKVEGMEVLRRIRDKYPMALVVMITAFGSQKLAVDALRAGAYDYFTKPFEMEELRIILRRALDKQELLKKVQSLERQLVAKGSFHRLIGSGPGMRRVFDLIQRVSAHDITVLITGESGAGKELVAEAIHLQSLGAEKPFIKVNCAAIPETLLESELFGHEKGAFTGAVASKPGKFELADGGSILLDEIGEMPLALQAKLLRVLQEKQVERIGDTKSRPIEVRIMTATNRDLARMVREKMFREDLFFRINVLPICVPPLRERPEDIAALTQHLIEKHGSKQGHAVTGVTPEALKLLEAFPWPGNVRELENIIQRAIVMTGGSLVGEDALPDFIRAGTPAAGAAADDAAAGEALEAMTDAITGPLAEQVERVVEREEKRIILAALRRMNDHRQETADLLGISRKSLHNKMHKYGLLRSRTESAEPE